MEGGFHSSFDTVFGSEACPRLRLWLQGRVCLGFFAPPSDENNIGDKACFGAFLGCVFMLVEKVSVLGGTSAARRIVSGLVLVAKLYGNDVPRLTFWLPSYCLENNNKPGPALPKSARPSIDRNGAEK
ncbi:hypothetical protein M0R45_032010 [Rubus argutus]|uniref:Uncharacterized protein n=1 Tax=Rubus argutus TaxID=59490 RepID=A0AAW1WI80_RUBAR